MGKVPGKMPTLIDRIRSLFFKTRLVKIGYVFETYVHDIPGPGLFDLFIRKAHEILSSFL